MVLVLVLVLVLARAASQNDAARQTRRQPTRAGMALLSRSRQRNSANLYDTCLCEKTPEPSWPQSPLTDALPHLFRRLAGDTEPHPGSRSFVVGLGKGASEMSRTL